MKIFSLKEFSKSKGFTQVIPEVRMNSNNYPFLTFISAENKAENIYFGRRSGTKINEGEILSSTTIASLSVAETVNGKGEVRMKLTFGESNRLDIDDICG